MISKQDAERFADEWIKAWNDHELAAEVFELTPGGRATRVLCHYDELSS